MVQCLSYFLRYAMRTCCKTLIHHNFYLLRYQQKKKCTAPARLRYRARKHAKLTLSAMFPDMPPAVLETIVVETNMQVATEVCLGWTTLQSIQRSVNSGAQVHNVAVWDKVLQSSRFGRLFRSCSVTAWQF